MYIAPHTTSREYENHRSVGLGPTNIRPDRHIFEVVCPADRLIIADILGEFMPDR